MDADPSASAAQRGRRISLTTTFSEQEPLEGRFLEMYDGLPREHGRRQEFLRRTLLLGVALQAVIKGGENDMQTLREIAKRYTSQIQD